MMTTTMTKFRTISVLFLLLQIGVITAAFQLNTEHHNARQRPFQTRADFLQRSVISLVLIISGTMSPPSSAAKAAVEESLLFLPKDAQVQFQKAQKAAKKEIKKVNKEIKKVEKKTTKEIKSIQKEVKKETKKIKKEVKVVQKDITKEIKKVDKVVSKKTTQALQQSNVGQAVNAIGPPATTTASGVDVSRLKVCDGVKVKCVR
mmetsp:Transcript_8961/g.13778  ORF Transcript_8961/g.13778 Transcript_8961/m.13778 type:complete len:204 (+) Transcript_8961:424-1035(+)